MTYTAASHLGAIDTFWLHYQDSSGMLGHNTLQPLLIHSSYSTASRTLLFTYLHLFEHFRLLCTH